MGSATETGDKVPYTKPVVLLNLDQLEDWFVNRIGEVVLAQEWVGRGRELAVEVTKELQNVDRHPWDETRPDTGDRSCLAISGDGWCFDFRAGRIREIALSANGREVWVDCSDHAISFIDAAQARNCGFALRSSTGS